MTDPKTPKQILDELEVRATDLLRRSRDLVEVATQRRPRRMDLPVSIQRASANSKLSPQRKVLARNGRIRNEPTGPFVVSTYVSIIATCPDTCPFRSGGCYAIAGSSHLNGKALDRAAEGWPADEVSIAEARAIDALWGDGVPQDGARGGRDLRLHVAGDASSAVGARALGDAAQRWLARGGGRPWTYTHRWREIRREAWGPISVLASCETPEDVHAARSAGYVAAIVVESYPDWSKAFEYAGQRAIPCPAEVEALKRRAAATSRTPGEVDDAPQRMTCSRCGLCMDDAKLRKLGLLIAFAVHGSEEEAARDQLELAEEAARRRLQVLQPTRSF